MIVGDGGWKHRSTAIRVSIRGRARGRVKDGVARRAGVWRVGHASIGGTGGASRTSSRDRDWLGNDWAGPTRLISAGEETST